MNERKNPQKAQKLSRTHGVKIIRDFHKTLPDTPGVYRMLGAKDEPLYIGKAKSLKKRVAAYTKIDQLPFRLQHMVASTLRMECTLTETEAQALLLEANLIKKMQPRFNILLRDGKSFPFIHLTGDHDFPMVRKHRGVQKRAGQYFGPFASADAVNRTITALQKVFMIRNCNDHVFANRSRPCLQYHIKRCTAPCVNYVGKGEYAKQIKQAQSFLDGKSQRIHHQFAEEMQQASAAQDYERAAQFRDRIKALTTVQSYQTIHFDGIKNADIAVVIQQDGRSCVQIFFIRAGQNYGNHAFFPKHDSEATSEDIALAVLAQFYARTPPPQNIFTNVRVRDKAILEQSLSQQADKAVSIRFPQRGEKLRAIEMAERGAKEALKRHIALSLSQQKVLEQVAQLLKMEERPERIEVYDNSHTSGTHMVSAMIVAGQEGLTKSAYRKFNIKDAKPSDDYGMMYEVFSRRFAKLTDENFPDLVLVDGGAGQLSQAKKALEELGLDGRIYLLAIAKGADRNAGLETFYTMSGRSFTLPPNDPALHYFQTLRDEAHRFAIAAHRTRRTKGSIKSELDDLPGIGAARKRSLLTYFGSVKDVKNAGVEDLMRVKGISKSMAQKIYEAFH